MDTSNPSEFYIAAVRQLCFQYEKSGRDDFLAYLIENYDNDKKQLLSLPEQESSNDQQAAELRNGIFVFAVGMFAHGKLSAAEDTLTFLPNSGAVRKLVLALKAMLPLPAHLDPLKDPYAVRLWLQENCGELKWNGSIGRYERVAMQP
jgi:hypothetical protein